jgi:hypothetical protein
MPVSLFVAIWSVNTVEQKGGSWLYMPVMSKIDALKQALIKFNSVRSGYGDTLAPLFQDIDKVRAIFVAPEYMFAGANKDGDRDYITETQLNSVRHFMPGSGNALFVPGSIAYRVKATSMLRGVYLEGVQKVSEYVRGHTVDRIANTKRVNFARNGAYGFLNGKQVINCYKQGDATDGFGEGDVDTFVPGWGTNKAQLNTVGGAMGVVRTLTFSLEICADSGQHQGGYRDLDSPGDADVKILVSATLPQSEVHTNYTHCCIHASSDPANSGILVRGRAAFEKLKQSTLFYKYPLDFYMLTIP